MENPGQINIPRTSVASSVRMVDDNLSGFSFPVTYYSDPENKKHIK